MRHDKALTDTELRLLSDAVDTLERYLLWKDEHEEYGDDDYQHAGSAFLNLLLMWPVDRYRRTRAVR